MALGLLAFDIAGANAGAVLGTALAIKMLAYIGVAPVASALVERLPRRAVLVTLDLVRAGVALVLPFVTQVWEIYVLIFVLQGASAAFTPAFQATIPAGRMAWCELRPGHQLSCARISGSCSHSSVHGSVAR